MVSDSVSCTLHNLITIYYPVISKDHDDMLSTRMTTLAFILSVLSSLDGLSGNFVSAFCLEYCKEYFHETTVL